MRVALINPPMPYLVVPNQQMPLGLAYLSAMVKREMGDVEVSLLNLSDLSIGRSISGIAEFDVYGYTATCVDYLNVLKLARGVARRFPGALHVIGGPHATLSSGSIDPVFDAVFVGEAEYELPRFLRDVRSGSPQKVYAGQRIQDLDELPFPDRESLGAVQGGKVLIEQEGQSTVVMGSRGCPYNCAFCASGALWSRKVRWRRVDCLVAEIKEAAERFGLRNFRFSDDNMTSNKPRFVELCSKLAPLGVKWRMSARVDSLDGEVLEALRGGGCVDVNLGVESFDADVLRAMNKNITPEQSVDAVRRLAGHGVNARLLMMISTPGETHRHTVDENVRYLERVRGLFAMVSLKTLVPLPGTPIWNGPEEYGVRIVNRSLDRFNFYMYERGEDGSPVETPVFSNITIDGMTREQQLENIIRMREYVASLPQNNTGE